MGRAEWRTHTKAVVANVQRRAVARAEARVACQVAEPLEATCLPCAVLLADQLALERSDPIGGWLHRGRRALAASRLGASGANRAPAIRKVVQTEDAVRVFGVCVVLELEEWHADVFEAEIVRGGDARQRGLDAPPSSIGSEGGEHACVRRRFWPWRAGNWRARVRGVEWSERVAARLPPARSLSHDFRVHADCRVH